MQWDEFQTTAERLALGTTEGDWRSATSRGYYAVFHYFREWLASHGLNIGQGSQAHSNLYFGLMNCGFPAVAGIANTINDLRKRRAVADYDLGVPCPQAQVTVDVQVSRDVVADFQALLATIPAAQIVDGARQHLQSIGRLGPPP
ncbi:MAG TPA: hypothetical protein VFA26_02805 [Gemmataceae bacterium]|nr:hypothetical protein [Gemmataceae bacterium]